MRPAKSVKKQRGCKRAPIRKRVANTTNVSVTYTVSAIADRTFYDGNRYVRGHLRVFAFFNGSTRACWLRLLL